MNSPPAFPHVADILQVDGNTVLVKTLTQNGMTLRDYMAARAMQGMYANGSFPTGIMLDTAKEAYEMADAMMKAREA
jgi:hypothetical protein